MDLRGSFFERALCILSVCLSINTYTENCITKANMYVCIYLFISSFTVFIYSFIHLFLYSFLPVFIYLFIYLLICFCITHQTNPTTHTWRACGKPATFAKASNCIAVPRLFLWWVGFESHTNYTWGKPGPKFMSKDQKHLGDEVK